MKKFIEKIIRFSLSLIIIVFSGLLITSFAVRQVVNLKLDHKKNILVLGNSHPEHAINDEILDNYLNLAQSGTAYFYDFLKFKELIRHNPQIDTLIIGYSYEDISKERDMWLTSSNRIKHKFRNFFYLMDLKDYQYVFRANPLQTLLNTPQCIYYNIFKLSGNLKHLGGNVQSKKNKIEEALERKKNIEINLDKGLSKYQTEYLQYIYRYSEKHGVKMVLLNTPIHSELSAIQKPLIKNYFEFARKNLKNALILDHSSFEISNIGFLDLDHLNSTGSKQYSLFLKENGLQQKRTK